MSNKSVFYALGTENSILIENQNAEDVLSKIVDRVLEIDENMSAFKASSEISKISMNAGIGPVSVSEDVFNVLEKALKLTKASNGAFDITIRPLTKLWNFGSGNDSIPEEKEIEAAKDFVGYKHLGLEPNEKNVLLSRPGCEIDLGGIAKGYAADEAKRILLENGITSALINLGGNIVALGKSFDDNPWIIGIQNPLSERGDYALTLAVSDKTVVTTAVNERFFIRDGIRYHHIIDPSTGYPARSGLLSVTVIDECSMLADALSTAVFVLGAAEGMKLIQMFKSKAIFITEEGDILSSFEIKNKAGVH